MKSWLILVVILLLEGVAAAGNPATNTSNTSRLQEKSSTNNNISRHKPTPTRKQDGPSLEKRDILKAGSKRKSDDEDKSDEGKGRDYNAVNYDEYYESYYHEDSDGEILRARWTGAKTVNRKIKMNVAWALYKLQKALDHEDADVSVNKSRLHDVFHGKSGMTFLDDKTNLFLIKPNIVISTFHSSDEDVQLVTTERDVYLHVRQGVMVPCFPDLVEMSEVNSIHFVWKNSSDYPMRYDDLLAKRVSLTNNQELWIKKAKESDSGAYSCYVETAQEDFKQLVNSDNLINVHVYRMALMGLVQKVRLLSVRACDEGSRKAGEAKVLASVCMSQKDCNYKVTSKCHVDNSHTDMELALFLLPPKTFNQPQCSDSCILSHTAIYLSQKRFNISSIIRPLQDISKPNRTQVEEKFFFYCQPGYFLYRFVCSPCFRGTYVEKAGPNRDCSWCSKNHYQGETGSTECHKCPTGSYTYGNLSRNYARCTTTPVTAYDFYDTMILSIVFLCLSFALFLFYHIIKCVVRIKKSSLGKILQDHQAANEMHVYDAENPFKIHPMVLGREVPDTKLSAHAIDTATMAARNATLPYWAEEFEQSSTSSDSTMYIFDMTDKQDNATSNSRMRSGARQTNYTNNSLRRARKRGSMGVVSKNRCNDRRKNRKFREKGPFLASEHENLLNDNDQPSDTSCLYTDSFETRDLETSADISSAQQGKPYSNKYYEA